MVGETVAMATLPLGARWLAGPAVVVIGTGLLCAFPMSVPDAIVAVEQMAAHSHTRYERGCQTGTAFAGIQSLRKRVEILMTAPDGRPLSTAQLIKELKAIRVIVDDLLARAQGMPAVDQLAPLARPPSQKLRIAAARLRVSSDRQVRRATPRWIEELARQRKPTGIE